jgi:hypothetical protein
MSLINDALKQTKQARPPNPPSNPPPLPPVETHSPEGLGWLVPGIIVLLLAAAGIFVGLLLSKPARLAASAMPAAVTAPKPVQTVALAPTVVTKIASNASPVVVAPPKPPAPKLQGILFAVTRPCAIVNGRTVFVGDRINEFRVMAISRDDVTLQSATETNVLSLSPQ